MPGPITVVDGAEVIQAPSDKRVYVFNFDAENLAVGVTITAYTHTITAISPSTGTGLTKDSESLLSGSRKTQLRLLTNIVEFGRYRVDCHITTNESPVQEKTKKFFLKVER